MWPFYRILILTAFLAASGQALAQATVTMIPAPPNSALATQSTPSTLAPAPTIQPLLSPRDQANADKHAAAEAAAKTPATTSSITPAVVSGVAPGANAIPAQQVIAAQQAQLQMLQQQQMQAQAAAQQQQPIIAPPPTQAAPSATAAIIPVEPAAQQAPQQAAPSLTPGFAPANTVGTIPTTTGMMPISNAGIDMHLSPNIVAGGVEQQPGGTQGSNNDMPYEMQLQQRTQELQQQARGLAFEQAKKSALPMEPYEIRDVLGRLKDTQEAIQTPARPAPKPDNVIKTISTDPGVKPQTIHLAASNVTTINIIDITGEPWPIVDIGFGGPFDVKPPEAGGHVIRISPKKDFAHGNLVVRLLKLTTPITFSLESGGDTVDYRFDARIPENGPNAKVPVMGKAIGMVAGDKVTTSFLEGVPPTGADKITVDGTDGRTSAYRYSGALYVRTPLALLSPAWQGSATSSDGMNIYVLEDTPVLLLSDKGELVRAHMGQKSDSTTSADATASTTSKE